MCGASASPGGAAQAQPPPRPRRCLTRPGWFIAIATASLIGAAELLTTSSIGSCEPADAPAASSDLAAGGGCDGGECWSVVPPVPVAVWRTSTALSPPAAATMRVGSVSLSSVISHRCSLSCTDTPWHGSRAIVTASAPHAQAAPPPSEEPPCRPPAPRVAPSATSSLARSTQKPEEEEEEEEVAAAEVAAAGEEATEAAAAERARSSWNADSGIAWSPSLLSHASVGGVCGGACHAASPSRRSRSCVAAARSDGQLGSTRASSRRQSSRASAHIGCERSSLRRTGATDAARRDEGGSAGEGGSERARSCSSRSACASPPCHAVSSSRRTSSAQDGASAPP